MSIVIDAKPDAAAGYRPVTDHQALVAGHPRCLGLWSFEADKVTQGPGGIALVANAKPGGVPLDQTDETRRLVSTYDERLRRQVALFDPSKGQVLTATGLVWHGDFEWTIVVIAEATTGNGGADFHMIAGDAALPDFFGLINTDRTTFMTRTGKTNIGSATTMTGGRPGWNRLIASQRGLGQPLGQANEGTIATDAIAGNNFNPSSTTFRVGNAFYPFGGRIDRVLLFDVDLFQTANAALLASVHAYLDEATGLYV